MKETKTQISKIVIELAGHKIDLTIEQAHELQKILNTTFPQGNPSVTVIERDRWYPYYPYHGGGTVPFKKWDVTCSLGTANAQAFGTMMLSATNDARRH